MGDRLSGLGPMFHWKVGAGGTPPTTTTSKVWLRPWPTTAFCGCAKMAKAVLFTSTRVGAARRVHNASHTVTV